LRAKPGRKILRLLILLAAAGSGVSAQLPQPAAATRVVIQFPPRVLSPHSSGHFLMRGPGPPTWGYGTFWDSNHKAEVGRTGPDELTIDASHKGRSAQSFKAWFYLPEYGFALIDVADLTPGAARVVVVPNRTGVALVKFAGRVVLPSGVAPRDVTISLMYWPDWNCEFFVLLDCLTGPFEIDSTRLTRDSTFSFEVPDFSVDPSLQPFKQKGTFFFSATTKSTDNETRELSIGHGLPVTPSRTSLVLTAVKR
jgi:hypothetical protein